MIQELPMESILQNDKAYVWHPFTQAKTAPKINAISSAKGVVLKTFEGKEIIDYISSWWVNIHGHCNEHIAKAIYEQATQLEQVIFAGFTHEKAVGIAQKLAQYLPSPLQRTFFSDNGSTAIEVAIKMAHQYHSNQGKQKSIILTFDGAYHGDTVGAMSVGKSSGFFNAWESLLFEVEVLPYPHTFLNDDAIEQKEVQCLKALDELLIKHKGNISAIILEPLIQGAGGMRIARAGFLKAVCDRVKAAGALVIFDEVMTGFGRTGTMFACEQITPPDIIALSKGLTAGFLPMSVTVCSDEIYEAFWDDSFDKAFVHGHSFTANPLGCACALASLEVFEQEQTLQKIQNIQRLHQTKGVEILSQSPHLEHIRVQGTIIAVDVKVNEGGYNSSIGNELKAYFWENGALIRPLGNVIYLLPPYVIEEQQLIKGYEIIVQAVDTLMGSTNGLKGQR